MILIARIFVVPNDFGIHEKGYMYGWYRKANESEWKALGVKYQGKEYCMDCHAQQEKEVRSSRHNIIECENCHGPALEHPSDPQKLTIDRSRELCQDAIPIFLIPPVKGRKSKASTQTNTTSEENALPAIIPIRHPSPVRRIR
jgi:hypothetical protein